RHRVQAAVETEVGIERAHEVGVLLSVGEWTEGAVGELANVALGPAEDEAVRAEVVEHRDRAVAAHRAPDDDGLLRPQHRDAPVPQMGRTTTRSGSMCSAMWR